MTNVIQSALTMLRAAEWMPVMAARVLIGIFFCISGGTKLFIQAQFGVLEQTMVNPTSLSLTRVRSSSPWSNSLAGRAWR